MTALSDAVDRDLRLALLEMLAGQVGYEASAGVLHAGAMALRIRVSLDKIVTELDWLAEQRLVETEVLPKGVVMAIATQRGRDVAAGLAAVKGVSQPDPLSRGA